MSGNFVFYIALVIILVNAYMRLTSWGEPKVRLRDVGADLKKGLLEMKKEFQKMPLKGKDMRNQNTRSAVSGTGNTIIGLEKNADNTDITIKADHKKDVKTKTASSKAVPVKKTGRKTASNHKKAPLKSKISV